MRNVTVSLDDETAQWARLEAARQDTSMSRLIGELLRRHMMDATEYERARRSYLKRAAAPLSSEGTAYPTRDELYTR